MSMHPLVIDLVSCVSRTFYRDEYGVVLNALTRCYLRDDMLAEEFGVSDKQIRKVLTELQREGLVCQETVIQRFGKRRARGELNMDAVYQEMFGRDDGTGKKRDRDEMAGGEEGEEGEGSDEGEEAADGDSAGAGGRPSRFRRVNKFEKRPGTGAAAAYNGVVEFDEEGRPVYPRKIRARVWYLNPRYFVDCVKYRVFAVKKFLERLETFEGNEAMFKCAQPHCRYECTLMEAQQRHSAELLSSMMSGRSGEGGGPGRGGKVVFRCILCGHPLTVKQVERVASTAARLLQKFTEQCKVAGITDVLASLETVRLGANRPSDALKAGKFSFLDYNVEEHEFSAEVALASFSAAAVEGYPAGMAGPGLQLKGQRGPKASAISAGMYHVTSSAPATSSGGGAMPFGRYGAGGSGSSGGGGGGASGSTLRLGSTSGGGGSGGGGGGRVEVAGGGSGGGMAGPAAPVAPKALPAHLTRSSITGEKAAYVGFLRVAGRDGVAATTMLGSSSGGGVASSPYLTPDAYESGVGAHGPVSTGYGSASGFDANINGSGQGGSMAGGGEGMDPLAGITDQELWALMAEGVDEDVEVEESAASGGVTAPVGGEDEEWEEL